MKKSAFINNIITKGIIGLVLLALFASIPIVLNGKSETEVKEEPIVSEINSKKEAPHKDAISYANAPVYTDDQYYSNVSYSYSYNNEYGGYFITKIQIRYGYYDSWPYNVKLSLPSKYSIHNVVGIADNLPIEVYYTYHGYTYNAIDSIRHIKLPNTIKYIGNGAFTNDGDYYYSTFDLSQCYALQYVGNNAFDGRQIVQINETLNKLTYIGDYAFRNSFRTQYEENDCIYLNKIEHIGIRAFDGSIYLKNVNLGENLKYLGEYAFNGCTALEYIYLSETIESIGRYAFNGCIKLMDAQIYVKHLNEEYSVAGSEEKSYRRADGIFNGCTSLVTVTL